jgi:DNA-directed RNA polymerase subunit RPC12/RpoP
MTEKYQCTNCGRWATAEEQEAAWLRSEETQRLVMLECPACGGSEFYHYEVAEAAK